MKWIYRFPFTKEFFMITLIEIGNQFDSGSGKENRKIKFDQKISRTFHSSELMRIFSYLYGLKKNRGVLIMTADCTGKNPRKILLYIVIWISFCKMTEEKNLLPKYKPYNRIRYILQFQNSNSNYWLIKNKVHVYTNIIYNAFEGLLLSKAFLILWISDVTPDIRYTPTSSIPEKCYNYLLICTSSVIGILWSKSSRSKIVKTISLRSFEEECSVLDLYNTDNRLIILAPGLYFFYTCSDKTWNSLSFPTLK